MSGMDDLVVWLRAILDDAEHGVRVMVETGERVDEAYELADIEAKRAILDQYKAAVAARDQVQADFDAEARADNSDPQRRARLREQGFQGQGEVNALRRTVRLLASAYRHRPGYREEWAPR